MQHDLRSGLLRVALAMVAVLGVLMALGVTLRDEIAALGQSAVQILGYPGIFAGILASDMFTLPIPPLAYIAVAVAAQMDPLALIAVSGLASVLGGIGAYGLGRLLQGTRLAERLMAPFRNRAPEFQRKMGLAAVVAIAVTPLPYSIVCTLAGMAQLRFALFWPATLFRIPRMAGYWGIVWLGWTATS